MGRWPSVRTYKRWGFKNPVEQWGWEREREREGERMYNHNRDFWWLADVSMMMMGRSNDQLKTFTKKQWEWSRRKLKTEKVSHTKTVKNILWGKERNCEQNAIHISFPSLSPSSSPSFSQVHHHQRFIILRWEREREKKTASTVKLRSKNKNIFAFLLQPAFSLSPSHNVVSLSKFKQQSKKPEKVLIFLCTKKNQRRKKKGNKNTKKKTLLCSTPLSSFSLSPTFPPGGIFRLVLSVSLSDVALCVSGVKSILSVFFVPVLSGEHFSGSVRRATDHLVHL